MPSRSFAVLVAVAGLFLACDATSPPPPQQFPNLLQRGEAWTYDVRFTQRPVDSTALDTVFTAQVRMEVAGTGERIGDQSGLIEVTTASLSAPDSLDRTWYRQSPDSLVDVAYTTPTRVGGTLPLTREKSAALSRRAHLGLSHLPLLVQRYASASPRTAARDTVVRSDSRVVLQSPLEPGATWTSFRDPFLSVRTVSGDTTLDTPAGRFPDAVEVENRLPDLAPSLRWSDFVAPAGLIRRVVTDTLERRPDDGGPTQRYISRETYTLTDYR